MSDTWYVTRSPFPPRNQLPPELSLGVSSPSADTRENPLQCRGSVPTFYSPHPRPPSVEVKTELERTTQRRDYYVCFVLCAAFSLSLSLSLSLYTEVEFACSLCSLRNLFFVCVLYALGSSWGGGGVILLCFVFDVGRACLSVVTLTVWVLYSNAVLYLPLQQHCLTAPNACLKLAPISPF